MEVNGWGCHIFCMPQKYDMGSEKHEDEWIKMNTCH